MASCTQVDSLLQAYIDGELSAAEKAILEQHISECRSCAALLKRQRASSALIFEMLGDHRLSRNMAPEIMAHLPEMEPSYKRAHEMTMRTKQQGKRVNLFQMLMPVAAVSVLLVLAFLLAWSWPSALLNEGRAVGMVTHQDGRVLRSREEGTQRSRVALKAVVTADERFETADKASLMITLAGPTHLKADGNTRVKVVNEREIGVETGRIWLSVAKDERLFRVTTPSGDITVFGTVFNVEVTADRTVVTVESGRVQVSNDVAFTQLEPGQQVSVRLAEKPLRKVPVDVQSVVAWASAIQADPEALKLCQEMIHPAVVKVLRAEQAFVVDVSQHTVRAITFEWDPAEYPASHCGYHIYVSDDHMNPLFKGHIPGEAFEVRERTSFELVVPEGISIADKNVLHISVVPDRDSGADSLPFTEVAALSL